jgi:exosortase
MAVARDMTAPSSQGGTILDGIREEMPGLWRAIPDKGLFFGLLGAWMVLFHVVGNSTFGYIDTPSLFGWLNATYGRPDSEDSHGYLIPLVVLGLMWMKRERLLAVPKGLWWPGLFGLAGAVLLHVVGYMVQQPKVSVVAFLFGAYALVATVWGWRLAREIAFPVVLFVFSVPMAGQVDFLTVPLRRFSADVTVFITRHLLGIPVIQEGVQLLDPRGAYHYEVAAACSGINSLITLTVLTSVYGLVNFTRTWKRLLVFALALPLAVAGNVLRLVSIIVAAEGFGRAAGDFVHEWFGFVTFGLALAALLAVGHWLREAPGTGTDALTPRPA